MAERKKKAAAKKMSSARKRKASGAREAGEPARLGPTNDPTTDARTFTVERLIRDADGFFNLPVGDAAGGLYGRDPQSTMTVMAAYAAIVAWLGSTPGGGGGGGGGGTPTKVGSSRAAIGSGSADGDLAICRLGTWPNVHEELLVWNAAQLKWVGEEKVVLTQNDRWSLDLGDYPESLLAAQTWAWFKNPNPNANAAFVLLNGSHNFSGAAFAGGTGVVSVKTSANFDTTPFAAAGVLRIRDNKISYTGKTANSFTGCTLIFGSGSVCTDNSDVVQGGDGGFGVVASPVAWAKEMKDAGFWLQERLVALMNASPQSSPGVQMDCAAYWVQYDNGDGYVAPTNPPTGGLGLSAALTSTTAIGTNKPGERPFAWVENPWTDMPAFTVTKRYMQPRLYGKMHAGATDTGQVLDALLRVRWVG